MTADPQLWSAHDARPHLVDGARFRLFALSATAKLGKAIAETLGQPLAVHEERDFEDGEV